MVGDNLINQAVVQGLLGVHKVIPLGVLLHLLQGFSGVFRQHPVHLVLGALEPFGPEPDIGNLSLDAAAADKGLVNHNLAVGQGKALPLGAGGKEEGPHE